MTRLLSHRIAALAVALSLVTGAGVAAAVTGTVVGTAHPRAAIVPPGQQYTCVGTQDPSGQDHWIACVWY